MIAQTIKPNIAIVTDVTHDTTTPIHRKEKEGHMKCGDRPVIVCSFCSSHHQRFNHRYR